MKRVHFNKWIPPPPNEDRSFSSQESDSRLPQQFPLFVSCVINPCETLTALYCHAVLKNERELTVSKKLAKMKGNY